MSRIEGTLGQVNSLLEKWGELGQNPVFKQMLARFQPPGRLGPGQAVQTTGGDQGKTQIILALIMQKWGKKTINEILKEIGPLSLEEAIRKALGG